MSTPGHYGFILDGEPIVAFRRFDAYPEGPHGLGYQIALGLKGLLETIPVDRFKDLIRAMELVPDECPIDEDFKKKVDSFNVNQIFEKMGIRLDFSGYSYYELFREVQGNVALFLMLNIFPLSEGFYTENYEGQWGYLINLDTERFEVYAGDIPLDGRVPDRSFPLEELDLNVFENLASEIYEDED